MDDDEILRLSHGTHVERCGIHIREPKAGCRVCDGYSAVLALRQLLRERREARWRPEPKRMMAHTG